MQENSNTNRVQEAELLQKLRLLLKVHQKTGSVSPSSLPVLGACFIVVASCVIGILVSALVNVYNHDTFYDGGVKLPNYFDFAGVAAAFLTGVVLLVRLILVVRSKSAKQQERETLVNTIVSEYPSQVESLGGAALLHNSAAIKKLIRVLEAKMPPSASSTLGSL
jgi:hypothetical protein